MVILPALPPPLPHPSSFLVSPGVEGGFDLNEEKFEYDEDVKIVILPDYLEIARDGLGGLPDIVRDRVQTPSLPTEDSGAGGVRAAGWWASSRKTEDGGVGGAGNWVPPLTFCFPQVTSAVEALLSADSASRKQEVQAWDGEVRQVSKHAFNLKQLDNPARIPPW